MNILGIVTKTHDAGAAVLQDGRLAVVIEEERLNREKHTKSFPDLAIGEIFGRQGFDIQDFDAITIPWNMQLLRRSFAKAVASNFPQSMNLLRPAAHKTQDTAVVNIPMRVWLQLGKHVGYKNLPKIHQVAHHDAHAAIYNLSPFEEATILVMDGYGDQTATSVYVGEGNRLNQQWVKNFFDSLGMLYTCFSEHLGFPTFQEGTVMALAACGGPKYVEDVRQLVTLLPDGQFAINRDHIKYHTHGFIDPFQSSFHKMFGPPRKPGDEITERQCDLAHALQRVTEETILHVVRELSKRYPSRNLILSGGVALNCVANARVAEETDYENVWVPPVASDSGVVLGSTLWHYHQTLGHPREQVLTHAYYGLSYDDHEIVAALERAGLTFERLDDAALFQRTAHDLSEQKIVGWFQGAAEIGPRALGNRSILSDARSNKMKDLINARVKHREAFRPFAPVILIERLEEYFDFSTPDPFMTMAPSIRPEKLNVIPAAAHVDGTGRIQTIQRDANPRYYDVIAAYEKITGVPVILNTSFNRQEPVVNTPSDAISCFLRTDMDVLVLGNYYSRDRNPEAIAKAITAFENRGTA